MRNSRSKLRKVLPLVLGLAAGGVGIASADNAVNDSVFNTRTGDFIFVTDYMHKINRNENTNIDELVKGENIKRIYAMDPSEAIRSRTNFLNSKRAKQFYSQEERLNLIGRYKNFLNELSKQKISPSAKSLEALSGAVSDGIINPEELGNVEDNIYAIVKEGIDKKVGDYSVFYLTRLTSEKTSSQYEARIKELENVYNELAKKDEEQKENLPLPEIPKEEKKQREKKAKESKEKEGYFSLISQGTANSVFDAYSGSLGVRVNPFKNKNIGFGALLDLGFGLDKLTDSYSAPLSAGRTAYGTIEDTDKLSIGGSLETQLGPFVLGTGIDYKTWITNTVEKILDCSGDLVKSNTNAVPNRQVFGKLYGVAELPITDRWKIGTVLGYNWKDGVYAGLRTNFRLNNHKKRK